MGDSFVELVIQMRFLSPYLLLAMFGAAGVGLLRAAPVPFDLPAQPAAAALVAFAKQADVEILYSSAGLKNIAATEVRGVYEPEEAVARLLQGTGFTATRDITGKFVVVAAGKKAEDEMVSGRVIELPPLTVSTTVEEQPWNYLEIPGYEILARCKPSAVVRWADEVERLHRWLGVMLPDEFRIKRDVPTAVILYDIEHKPEFSPEVMTDLLRKSGAADGKTVAYRSLPNMRLADQDAMGFFFILDPTVFGTMGRDPTGAALLTLPMERRPGGAKLKLAEEYVHYLAKSRAPGLPDWFVEGVVDLFQTADFNGSDSAVVLAPMTWLTPDKTEEVRKAGIAAAYGIHLDKDELPLPASQAAGPGAQLPPLAELFAATRRPDRDAVLRNEAVLFLRWGLDGKNQPRRDALWKFLRLASAEPATEAMFRECFGFGYADARRQLGEYLLPAVTKSLRLMPAEAAPLPTLTLQTATPLQVARIKGEWDRLEISYVKSHHPELAPRYVAQARRTLHRAYDKGERDPRLLAVLGLCECDAGDDAAARPYLEAAIQGGVVRPRANYELARLRYAAARARATRSGDPLSAAQAAEVLEPLAQADQEQPPLLEAYLLAAEVWGRSSAPLTRRELDRLGQGVALFPWNVALVYQAAWLNGRHGFKAEADALIAHGLRITADATLVARFEQLRAALVAGRPLVSSPP